MANAISRRPATVHSDRKPFEIHAADQLLCGECDCDYWLAYHLASTNISVLECVECGALVSASLAEVSNESATALADYRPGNRGIYGGGDS